MLVAVVVFAAACADSAAEEATTTAVTSSTLAPATTNTSIEPMIPPQIEEWSTGYAELDGRELFVAVADTPEKRRQGLMEIDDLRDLDGMVFVFDNDTSGRFWMKNTLLPLDIAFFDMFGRFVDGFVMEPCTADPCPKYVPDGSYRFALEMEAGTMPENPQELTLPGGWAEED